MNFVNIDDLIINNVHFFVEVEDLVNMDNFIDSANFVNVYIAKSSRQQCFNRTRFCKVHWQLYCIDHLIDIGDLVTLLPLKIYSM